MRAWPDPSQVVTLFLLLLSAFIGSLYFQTGGKRDREYNTASTPAFSVHHGGRRQWVVAGGRTIDVTTGEKGTSPAPETVHRCRH
jgi:hypothetical protein